MANKDSLDYHTPCAEHKDEIEGLNERLLQLLSAQKVPAQNTNNSIIPRPLCNVANNNDYPKAEHNIPMSPMLSQYRYDCSYMHHDKPVNLPALPQYLPPIGVFWDIENCQVPKGKSALAVIQVIREKFFSGYREAEFIVVCDVQKESSQVVKELNDAQVNLIHVASMCKNAADEKLKQSIRRFADIHGSPAAVILISGDINFAVDLSDLRYRKKIHVILLYVRYASEALILCANEHYDFVELMESLPSRTPKVTESCDLIVSNLPSDQDVWSIKRRLKQLSVNCSGQVIDIQSTTAIIRFSSEIFAYRATVSSCTHTIG